MDSSFGLTDGLSIRIGKTEFWCRQDPSAAAKSTEILSRLVEVHADVKDTAAAAKATNDFLVDTSTATAPSPPPPQPLSPPARRLDRRLRRPLDVVEVAVRVVMI